MTPPRASAPYTAEAPPVMISTRSIIEEGMPLISVTINALTGVVRCPSTSTRLRFAPKPRREMVEIPTVFTAEGCTSEFSVVGVRAGL